MRDHFGFYQAGLKTFALFPKTSNMSAEVTRNKDNPEVSWFVPERSKKLCGNHLQVVIHANDKHPKQQKTEASFSSCPSPFFGTPFCGEAKENCPFGLQIPILRMFSEEISPTSRSSLIKPAGCDPCAWSHSAWKDPLNAQKEKVPPNLPIHQLEGSLSKAIHPCLRIQKGVPLKFSDRGYEIGFAKLHFEQPSFFWAQPAIFRGVLKITRFLMGGKSL